MGRIIQFPVTPRDFKETATSLDTAECVVLIAMRWWDADFRRDEDPLPRLSQAMEAAGVAIGPLTGPGAVLVESGFAFRPRKSSVSEPAGAAGPWRPAEPLRTLH
jgi:hypothetical protein